MSDSNQLIPYDDNFFLDIFSTEDDQKGTDLLKMSDFFGMFISKTQNRIDSSYQWEFIGDVKSYTGQIANAIKTGIDISNSEVLVADYSHFSKDIIDGLKSGIYHVGESKKVSGNLRPAILDKKEKIVKLFTLKKALNPIDVLFDFSTISMQMSLQQISSELKSIRQQIDYIIDLNRRKEMNNKFLNARSQLRNAFNNPDMREDCLIKADDCLSDGLNRLYSDLDIEIDNLFKQMFPKGNLKDVDKILGYIEEDMLMIPKYVAVKVYFLNYAGRFKDAKDTIEGYRFKLEQMNQPKFTEKGYTALELIHEMYPYKEENRDFWLEMHERTIASLDYLQTLIEQKDKDVFYIEATMEDNLNE